MLITRLRTDCPFSSGAGVHGWATAPSSSFTPLNTHDSFAMLFLFVCRIRRIKPIRVIFEGMIKVDDKALVEGMEISVPSLEDIMIHLERRS